MQQLADLLENHRLEVKSLSDQIIKMEEIINAVAHIGVDFGYGKYEIEDEIIKKARELINMGIKDL